MPHVANYLSNYANILLDGKRTLTINTNTEAYVHEVKEKEMNNNTSDIENKEWKSIQQKKCVLKHNNK